MTSCKPMLTKPLKFKTVEDLQTKIDKYFASCYITKVADDGSTYLCNIRPLTISGLAVDLDTTRRTLLDYGNKEEYSHILRKAKARIESFAEESLWQPKIASGIAFNLKNNFAWIDKQEIVADVTNTNKIVVAPVIFEEE